MYAANLFSVQFRENEERKSTLTFSFSDVTHMLSKYTRVAYVVAGAHFTMHSFPRGAGPMRTHMLYSYTLYIYKYLVTGLSLARNNSPPHSSVTAAESPVLQCKVSTRPPHSPQSQRVVVHRRHVRQEDVLLRGRLRRRRGGHVLQVPNSQRQENRRLCRRLARAPEAVAGRPVAWPLPWECRAA